MAGSYVLPQVRVFQEFSETPNDVTQNLNPCIIGPNYNLIRYSDSDEREDCEHSAYSGSAVTLNWKTIPTGSVVDLDYFKVTAVSAYVDLFGADKTGVAFPTSGVASTRFEFAALPVASKPAVAAGDYLAYKVGDATDYTLTKIRSIAVGTGDRAGDVSVAVTKKNGDTQSVYKITNAKAYKGEASDVILVTVDSDGKATWTSTNGVNSTAKSDVITTSGIAIGSTGLTFALNTGATNTAGVYKIKVTVSEAAVLDTVTTADIVPSDVTAFRFFRLIDEADIDADSYLRSTSTGVTVAANATLKVGSYDCAIVTATLYLTQRNLVKSHTDGVYSVSSDTDIIRELGAISDDNPLAFALHVALLNCATATVKYIALESNDAEGYATALDRVSITTEVYALCPLSVDRTIITSVVDHCDTMSSEENKSWRIAFFSMPTDKDIDVTPTDENGDKEFCTVSGATLTCVSGPVGTSSPTTSDNCNFTDNVSAGDTVEVTLDNAVLFTTTVADVASSTTLTLTDTLASTTGTAVKACAFKITHTRKLAEYVNAIASTSEGFKNHRAYNVFPNTLGYSDGTTVSGMYGAAAVCALACSVAPQQPITNVEVSGFTDLPAVYSKYNRDQLNTIAAGGTLILMQDKIGGSVYVRHQISTAYSENNLNTAELSLTKNLDSISYYFANRFAPYIGRYNVTDDLLTELKGIILDGLAYLETATETNRLIGPQVLTDGTEIRSLYRSDEKDKVYADVALSLPAPFNNFDLRLQVI